MENMQELHIKSGFNFILMKFEIMWYKTVLFPD